jgi:universal stress protein E
MKGSVKSILVAVSGPCTKVIKQVQEIATRSTAEIELCTIVRPASVTVALSSEERRHATQLRVEAAREHLQRLAEPLRQQGLQVYCAVEDNDSVVEGLLNRIRHFNPDLVAIEAHKHNSFARLLLNQTDYSLIRECPVPLLIVKTRPSKTKRNVLAALDPWAANGKPASLDSTIIDTARCFSKALQAPLHSAHVFAPMVGYLGDSMFAPVAVPVSLPEEKQYTAKVRKQFSSVNAKYRIAARNTHLKMGDPSFQLPRIARASKARMVVMGAVSRKIVKRALLGSTAERVLDAMPCDVLVVKPERPRVAA